MSQENNNRAQIALAIDAYMRKLPDPKELPAEIKIEIKYRLQSYITIKVEICYIFKFLFSKFFYDICFPTLTNPRHQ